MENPIKTGTEQQDPRGIKKLEEEWCSEKEYFSNELDLIRNIRLSRVESQTLRTIREHAIGMSALIVNELIRRGEGF